MAVEARFSTGKKKIDVDKKYYTPPRNYEIPLFWPKPPNIPVFDFSNKAEYGPGVPLFGPKMFGAAYTVNKYRENNLSPDDEDHSIIETNDGNPKSDHSIIETNDGNPKSVNQTNVFACIQMPINHKSKAEATFENNFGSANAIFKRITIKLFNSQLTVGKILHGIVYVDLKKTAKIFSIQIHFNETILKQITIKKTFELVVPGLSYSIPILSTENSSNRRPTEKYVAQTKDFSGDYLMERLRLFDDMNSADIKLKCFTGPVELKPGTHAIPFAIKIDPSSRPSFSFKTENKNDKSAIVQNIHTLGAEIVIHPGQSNNKISSIFSKRVSYYIENVGALPTISFGKYAPGNLTIIPISYKDSNLMILTEKSYLIPGDTLRIYIYSNYKGAVKKVKAQLIKFIHLPDIDLFDTVKVKKHRNGKSVLFISELESQKMESKFSNTFISTVAMQYPLNAINFTKNTTPMELNDTIKMPIRNRIEGCKFTFEIPKDIEESISAEDTRLSYLVMMTFKVKGLNIVRHDEPVTICSKLMNNYSR